MTFINKYIVSNGAASTAIMVLNLRKVILYTMLAVYLIGSPTMILNVAGNRKSTFKKRFAKPPICEAFRVDGGGAVYISSECVEYSAGWVRDRSYVYLNGALHVQVNLIKGLLLA